MSSSLVRGCPGLSFKTLRLPFFSPGSRRMVCQNTLFAVWKFDSNTSPNFSQRSTSAFSAAYLPPCALPRIACELKATLRFRSISSMQPSYMRIKIAYQSE
ncbi:unnamed protein product [Soboliphyme baturini]|uniref:Secreted protein n=1 Tax=Soboliphyme baturini TaxID=241478 RepID=A0A183IKX5_9BILA|nr:unnamed protein product [Soboliphyme baturini]